MYMFNDFAPTFYFRAVFRMKKPLYGMLYQKYTVHRYMSIKMCLFSDQKATSSVSGIQLV